MRRALVGFAAGRPRAGCAGRFLLREGRRGRNALIGAALGGGLGLAAGAALLGITGGSDSAGAIVGGALAAGAGIGAGAGAAVPPYRTLYRARK